MYQGGVERRAKGFDLLAPALSVNGPTSGVVSNAYAPGSFSGTRLARYHADARSFTSVSRI